MNSVNDGDDDDLVNIVFEFLVAFDHLLKLFEIVVLVSFKRDKKKTTKTFCGLTKANEKILSSKYSMKTPLLHTIQSKKRLF